MPSVTARFAEEGTLQKGGHNLTYVRTPEAIERMNACFGYGGWQFKVLSYFRDEDFITCLAELSIKVEGEWISYQQFGGQQINRKAKRNDGTPGDIIDLPDDYKGAASDAMKKAAMHFGLGLYLALKRSPTPFSPASGPTTDAGRGSPAPREPETDSSAASAVSGDTSPGARQATSSSRSGGEPTEDRAIENMQAGHLKKQISELRDDAARNWLSFKRQHELPLNPDDYSDEQRVVASEFFQVSA